MNQTVVHKAIAAVVDRFSQPMNHVRDAVYEYLAELLGLTYDDPEIGIVLSVHQHIVQIVPNAIVHRRFRLVVVEDRLELQMDYHSDYSRATCTMAYAELADPHSLDPTNILGLVHHATSFISSSSSAAAYHAKRQ